MSFEKEDGMSCTESYGYGVVVRSCCYRRCSGRRRIFVIGIVVVVLKLFLNDFANIIGVAIGFCCCCVE